MKRIALIVALLFSGCTPYVSAPLLPSHPASGLANDASMYPVSETLVATRPEQSNEATKSPGRRKHSMEGMNHEMH